MANLIQIKRALTNATPASLADGELAWSGNGDILYIGNFGTVQAIATNLNPGTLTANAVLVANSSSSIDEIRTAKINLSSFAVTSIIDDDTFATGVSNTALATAESIKAYVDSVAGAGVSNLNDITDVDVATPSEGAFLVYDGTDSKWIDVTLAAGDGLVGSYANGTDTFTIDVVEGYGINVTADAVAVNNAEIRSLFSAAGDLSYNSTTGEFSFTNDAGDIESVTAGNGLTGGGTAGDVTLDVGAGNGITVNANDIEVNAGEGLFTNSAGVHVGAGDGITTNSTSVAVQAANSTINVHSSGISVNVAALSLANTQIPLLVVADLADAAVQTGAEVGATGATIGDNDTSLLTAAAVINFVEGKGYSTTTGTVTSVSGGNGLTGTVTSSGSLAVGAGVGITVNADDVAVNAQDGLVANSSGLFVEAGTGVTVNSTGVHIGQAVGTGDDVTFNDVTVSGDLTVSGNVVSIDVANLAVEDPLIKLAKDNTAADLVDIGFYGAYADSGTKYAGLFRDASDGSGVFKLFAGLGTEPTTTVGDVSSLLADLDVGALSATSLTLGTDLAVAHGGTGASSFTDNGIIYGNGSSALSVTAAGTEGQVLQAGAGGVPEFGSLDGGDF